MTQLSVCLVCLVVLASVPPSQAGPAQLRARREARPLLGGLVSDLASPFINFFRPRPRKRPARPQASHHHQRPAASYHRPSPSYPAPPVQAHYVPAPAPPQPQIQILPAPDLSHSAPQDSPAVAPPYEAPSEEPAVAPAYQPIYYGQELAPVYETQTYEPAVVEPAVVEPAVVEPAVVEPAVKEVEEVKIAAVIDTKSAPEPDLEAVDPVVEDEGRQPKLLVAVEDPAQFTGPQGGSEDEIIIDLTKDLDFGLDNLGVSNQIIISPPEEAKFVEVVEEVEEVLITGDQSDKEPQIISFTPAQIPSVFAPSQKTNEVISFVPVEPQQSDQSDLSGVEVESVPVLEEESSSPSPSPVSVTPLLQDEDLRSLLQQGEEQLDQLVPLDVVDLSDDDSEDAEDGFALIDSDYTEEDNPIADLEIDAIIEDITATENILENIVTTTPSNSPQATIKELEAVPPTIASDPVFKEIVSNGEEEKEQVKRGFSNYDPRHNRIYAHKYSDNYSNWYYFRRGY